MRRARRSTLDLRLEVLGLVVITLFMALFLRLLFLQIIESPRLAAAAQANTVRTVFEEAPRGRVVDRKGRVLAGNREADVITVEREAVRQDPALLGRLATFVAVAETELRRRFDDPKFSRYRPVPVVANVDKAVIAALRERQSDFPGVAAETQVERWYPEGAMAAHVLGYIGEINDSELSARKDENYRLGDDIGKSGIEQAYESDLRGRPGVDTIEVDSSGRPVRIVEHAPPVAGRDVQLALDLDVQRAAEEALASGLEAARNGTGGASRAPGGAVVAVAPEDGSLLAVASYPAYEPARFVNGISNEEYARLTSPESALPLNNRAISGQYAPGSTFKLVTAVAALRTHLISANTVIVDGGFYTLGNQRYQNAQGRAYGPVDITKSLTVSSDVFFYSLGARFWEARKELGHPIQATARDFGLGTKTGLSIAGEAEGRVPDPDNRRRLHEQLPQAYPEANWFGGDNVNLAIGQGDTLVTPIQLANLYAAFGTGGVLHQPLLVRHVLDFSGKPVTTTAPRVIRKVDIPPDVLDPITEGLAGAVSNQRGTAYDAFNGFDGRAFPVAGKTGTAQVTGKQDTALFAGVGPVGNPSVAVAVVLEESGFGGVAAAPVGRRVMASVAGQPIEPIRLGAGVD